MKTLLFIAFLYLTASTLLTILQQRFPEHRAVRFPALVVDFVFITKMCLVIGSLESYLVYAYFILVLLASLQLGPIGSVPMALSISAFDYYYTQFSAHGLYLYGPILVRIGFVWIGALALGITFQNIANSQAKIQQLNKNLDSKITILVSASRVLGSINDLDKLILYFEETISRIFGIDKHALIIKTDEEAKAVAVSSAGVDEEILNMNLFQIKEEMLLADFGLRDVGLSIGATHKGTQGFYVLLVGGDDLQKILTDKDIFQTTFSQLILAIDNALLVKQAKTASLTDHLTELYNQRYFYVRFTEELYRAKRTRGELSLLIIDVDNFKNYNDSYGHLNGDKALAKIANTIKTSCRESDIAARYGGEEFVMILPDTDSKSAIEVADRVIRGVRNERFPGESGELDVELTVSIGVASHPNHGSDIIEIIERADKALYKAKSLGKDQYAVARKKPSARTRPTGETTRSA